MDSVMTIGGEIAGAPMNANLQRSADGAIRHTVTLNAAKTGSLTTRTNDTDGTITAESGHGIQIGDVIDIYWSGGMRYGVTVDNVSGDDVIFAAPGAGAGDVLPSQGTAVTLAVQQVIDTDVDCDNLVAVGLRAGGRCAVGFMESSVRELHRELPANSRVWFWLNNSGTTNPLAGHVVDQLVATQAGTTDVQLDVGILYDSTP